MRAHQLDANGLILNTILVNSLDDLPHLVDAELGGSIGDSIIGGALVPRPNNVETVSFAWQKAVYLDEVRTMREKLLGRLNGFGMNLLLNEPPEQLEEKALCNEIIQGLLDITTIEPVLTATTIEQVKAAVKAEYARLVGLASIEMVKAFRKVDL